MGHLYHGYVSHNQRVSDFGMGLESRTGILPWTIGPWWTSQKIGCNTPISCSYWCNLTSKVLNTWLVVTGTFGLFFPSYWESHHPNWRTQIFQRGRYTTNQVKINIKSHNFAGYKPATSPLDCHYIDVFLVAESTRCVVKTTHPPHCPFYVLDIYLNPFNHHFFCWTCTYSLRVLVIKHGNGKPPKEFDDWPIYR